MLSPGCYNNRVVILRSWRNGRRAVLRGQWGYPRGSSSLLGRITEEGQPSFFVIYRVGASQSNSHRHLMTPGQGFDTIGNNKMK